MRVCDKCGNKKVICYLRADDQQYELCELCANDLKIWLKTPKGVLSKLLDIGRI